MRRLLLLIALCTVAGCEPQPPRDSEYEYAAKYGATLLYFKDSRTGLCFAGRALSTNWGVMATVPCTPEVEKLIR